MLNQTTEHAVTFSVLQSCNVSYAKKIDLDTLLGILTKGEDSSAWFSHLDTFFEELPISYLKSFVEQHNISYDDMICAWNKLPEAYKTSKSFERIGALYGK